MQATKKQTKMIQWMCVTAILTAANVVMSSFSIPVPGGHLYLNDVVICTAAILLDPLAAFFVGGVGAFLGDLLFYPLPMFVSLASHGLEAVAISLIARYLFPRKWYGAALGVTVGAVIMVTGYSLGPAGGRRGGIRRGAVLPVRAREAVRQDAPGTRGAAKA